MKCISDLISSYINGFDDLTVDTIRVYQSFVVLCQRQVLQGHKYNAHYMQKLKDRDEMTAYVRLIRTYA